MKKILPYLVAGALTIGSFGCAKKDLKVHYIELPGGYKTTARTISILETLAGIHAGTIQLGFQRIEKRKIKILTRGKYDMMGNPKSMEKIAEAADILNKDKIISHEEAKNLQSFLYNKILSHYLDKR